MRNMYNISDNSHPFASNPSVITFTLQSSKPTLQSLQYLGKCCVGDEAEESIIDES